MRHRLPVSVLIPTIGRPGLLSACLHSIYAGDAHPEEVIVVDQSDEPETERVVAEFATLGARRLHSRPPGISRAMNTGLNAVRHDGILVTHDDCTVDPCWLRTGLRLMSTAHEPAIFTGKVLPVGDPKAVPSTKTETEPHDYTGERACDVLYPSNMAVSARTVLEFGGFDERLAYAEDNDLCYRWLKAGRRLEYRPELVVHHHDWRTQEQLEALYVRYWYGSGQLYGKYLRRGDLEILRYLRRDLVGVGRTYAGGVVRRQPRWSDYGRGMTRGLPAGILDGWRRGAARPHRYG